MSLNHPHHDPSVRYVSNPSPAVDETVEIRLPLPDAWESSDVNLRTVVDGEAHWLEGQRAGLEIGFELPCNQPVQHYRFHLRGPHGAFWLNGGGLLDHDPDDQADFKLLPGKAAPDWVTERVWYQIFPDRFATTSKYQTDEDWVDWAGWNDPIKSYPDSMRQAYGGDLDGITERLDHITDLGIGGVYLTPVFPARSSHRYDARTFDSVDPILGGDAALVRLREACDRAGLKLTTDLTLNHTGDAHEWFRAAQADPASAEAGFYHFRHHPDDYETWLGVSSLPKLDHRNSDMAARFYRGRESTVAKYLLPPYELDGWRIDVANMAGRLGQMDLNQTIARDTRATMEAINSNLWLVGEHFFDAAADTPGDGWHGVMNYAGVSRPIASWLGKPHMLADLIPGPGQDSRTGVQVAAAMDAVREVMPWNVTLGSMSLLSSHDTARWRSLCVSDDAALVGFGLLVTLPGAPCFFYGDEIGLTGENNETSRRTMPWGAQEGQKEWDQRFHSWYRDLIRARNSQRALQVGGFRWVHVDDDQLVFLRETETERLLVRASRAPGAGVRLDVDLLGAREMHALLGGTDLTSTGGTMVLPSDGPEFSLWRLQ